MKDIINLITSDVYSVIISLIAVIIIIWGMYTKIKYLCLEKASEMIAKVEGEVNLSGEEKFAKCILWINQDLPKIFHNALFQTIIKNIVQYVYDNCFDFTKKYIKRKTGYDVSELVDQIKETVDKESTK